ncbi:hypothetical protein WA171_001355 [Blastocystis sp. BT1]
MLRSQMASILDLILFLDQQYPCLPRELEQNLQQIYKSTREVQLAKRSFKQRLELQQLIHSIDSNIRQFVILIGGTPLSIDLSISFCFSSCQSSNSNESEKENGFLTSRDLLTLKQVISTSDVFSVKSVTTRKKMWIYIDTSLGLVWDSRLDEL